MKNVDAKRTLINVPTTEPVSRWHRWMWLIECALFTPFYWAWAHQYDVPGLGFHLKCALLGLRLLFVSRARGRLGMAHNLMFLPMDSTRYFEFDFMWQQICKQPIGSYLDVSSPRWFPLVLLNSFSNLTATLMNPDTGDLAITTRFVRAAGFEKRCRLESDLIQTASFVPHSFDVITCISVIEHIPDDAAAVRRIWKWLKPGGRLLLSLPCAARTFEQHIDRNEYGLLEPDDSGFVFWQRFYDCALLEERIFRVTGQPRSFRVYGEKIPGAFQENARQKRAQPETYPYWREAYMMGREYRFFNTIQDLPGEGVIAVEFVKP